MTPLFLRLSPYSPPYCDTALKIRGDWAVLSKVLPLLVLPFETLQNVIDE